MPTPPDGAAITSADLQRLYDKQDELRTRMERHEQDDLKVHGEFRTLMASIDGKLESITADQARARENTAKMVWIIIGAVVLALLQQILVHAPAVVK